MYCIKCLVFFYSRDIYCIQKKSKPSVFTITLEVVNKFHQIWQIALRINTLTMCRYVRNLMEICKRFLKL